MSDIAPSSLFTAAHCCLLEQDPVSKVEMTRKTCQSWREAGLTLRDASPVERITEPGRPARPELVAPKALRRRSPNTTKGRAALIHALCHIEFNAINLAWDAVYRFRAMPREFYADWMQVAEEEAYHFQLLRAHLQGLGYDYGDFPAHNGLWEMAVDTDHDPLVRMALVPRVLEARGLDVTPGIQQRLRDAGDDAAVAILDIIHRDEIGHVAIGSRWFNFCCEERGLVPATTFFQLVREYMKGHIKPPLARDTRASAGFSQEELDYLENMG